MQGWAFEYDSTCGSIFTCLVLVNTNLKNFPGIGYRFNQAGKSRAGKWDVD